MNSMERILATLAGKPVDRRAVTPLLSLYGARLINCTIEQYYTDPASYVSGQLAVRETFRPDALFAPFAFASLGEAFGSELHLFKDHPPNIRRPAVSSSGELDTLVIPDIDTNPKLLYFRRVVQMMAKESKGLYPVVAVLPLPIDMPALVMGMDNWMETVLFDRAGAMKVLEKITPFFVRLANSLLSDGAAFIVVTCGFASPAIVTREIAVSFSRPAIRRALEQLKGPVVLHHVGTPILPNLDLLVGMPSTVAFAVDHNDDLGKTRKLIGKSVLFGGLNGPDLVRMDAEQVGKKCIAILEDRRHDAHFILSTSGADIPLNTPPENIHAIRKAAESFGSIGS